MYMYVCTYVCMCVCMYERMYVCMYACAYVCSVCIYMSGYRNHGTPVTAVRLFERGGLTQGLWPVCATNGYGYIHIQAVQHAQAYAYTLH